MQENKLNKIPRILLGTSPFIGAAQFGEKAREYRKNLYENPEHMATIIVESAHQGINAIQALAYPPIMEAIKMAQSEVETPISIIGTIPFKLHEEGLKLLKKGKAHAALIHGAITDRLDFKELNRCLKEIKDLGMIPGLATHNPAATMPEILKSDLEFDIFMVPIDKTGFFMKDGKNVLKYVAQCEKVIIAKKITSAGRIQPKEALEWAFSQKGVDCVAIGIASIEEARQTFSVACEVVQKTFGNNEQK